MHRTHSHNAMPHPGISIINEAWRELAQSLFETKLFHIAFWTFNAINVSSVFYLTEQLGVEVRNVLYINPFYVVLLGCIGGGSLVFRTYAYFVYYRLQGRTPPVSIFAWIITAWPSYTAWVFFCVLGANIIHRLYPLGQEIVMIGGMLIVLGLEVRMFGHYWFGDKDTIIGYLKRFFRVMAGVGRLSKGDFDGAMGALRDHVENKEGGG